jgi:Putative restriction endonuclease
MMAPLTLAHQVIAGNLQRLLDAALEDHAPTLNVIQRAGVNLAPAVEDYDPEPDMVVIDAEAAERPASVMPIVFTLAPRSCRRAIVSMSSVRSTGYIGAAAAS